MAPGHAEGQMQSWPWRALRCCRDVMIGRKIVNIVNSAATSDHLRLKLGAKISANATQRDIMLECLSSSPPFSPNSSLLQGR